MQRDPLPYDLNYTPPPVFKATAFPVVRRRKQADLLVGTASAAGLDPLAKTCDTFC
jgi:hypothetical protein